MKKILALALLSLVMVACTPETIIEYVDVEVTREVEVEVIKEVEVEVIVEVTPVPPRCSTVYQTSIRTNDCYFELWGAYSYLGEVFYDPDERHAGYHVAGESDAETDLGWDAVKIQFFTLTAELFGGEVAQEILLWENEIIELDYGEKTIGGYEFTIEYWWDNGIWAALSWTAGSEPQA